MFLYENMSKLPTCQLLLNFRIFRFLSFFMRSGSMPWIFFLTWGTSSLIVMEEMINSFSFRFFSLSLSYVSYKVLGSMIFFDPF
jgi:hypothetical protein